MNEHLNPLFRDILNAAAPKPASNYDDSHPGDCPELNMSNYDHDGVATLNAWAIQAAFCIDRLERERAALYEAAQAFVAWAEASGHRAQPGSPVAKAREAIARIHGEQK